jgi:serine---pyruvate transaminase
MPEIMKNHMMTPGPTDVPGEVLLAEATPQIHHRTPQFQKVYEEVHTLIKHVFKTQKPVFSLCASGTGAMECAVANLTTPGSKPIVVDGGWFGKRWNDICVAYGLETDVITSEWGVAVDPAEVESRLKKNPACPAVFVQLSETSTGGIHPIKELQAICSKTDTLLVVDGISGLGAQTCETDAWGLDCVLTGAQKSLMIPPGLAYITVSDRAWTKIDASKHPRFYFDLRKAKKGYEKMDHPFTPPTSLLWGQLKALQILEAEGIDNTVARHARMADATRAAAVAMGLKLFAKDPGNVLTSVHSPEGLASGKLVKKARDEYGVTLAGAQGPWKDKFFRIGHLGYCDDNDVVLGIACLERVMNEMGVKIPFGSGVKAAQEVLHAARMAKVKKA